jgi:spore germination protein KC
MLNKKLFIPFILLFLLSCNGCWDRRELESLALVQTLGLDLGPDGKGVTISTMIAIPPQLKSGGDSGGGGGSETGVFVISMDAPTIFEGFNLINTTVNREISLLQNSSLLIGEDLARQGVRKWIDSLIRYREMRRTLSIFVCQGKAADIIKVKPKLERNPGEYFNDLVHLNKLSGMFPMITLNEFLDRYEALAQENFVPLLGKFQRRLPDEEQDQQSGSAGAKSGGQTKDGGAQGEKTGAQPPPEAKDVRMIGAAIFKRDKMVGHFDIYETQVLQMLTGHFQEALLTVHDPLKKNYLIAFRLMAATPPQIKYKHQKSGDYFTVRIKMEAELISLQSGIDYTKPGKEEILNKQIAIELKRRILKTIMKAQKQYDSDVFGFGIKVRNTMLTGPDWDRYNWLKKFKDAHINVRVKVAIRRVGVQFHPPTPR